jgi:hypothetical protein
MGPAGAKYQERLRWRRPPAIYLTDWEMHTKFKLKTLEEWYDVRDFGVDWTPIFKLNFKEKEWEDVDWLRTGFNGRLLLTRQLLFGFHKNCDYIYHMEVYQIIKDTSTPCNQQICHIPSYVTIQYSTYILQQWKSFFRKSYKCLLKYG